MSWPDICGGLVEEMERLVRIVRSQAVDLAALGYPSLDRSEIESLESAIADLRQTVRDAAGVES